MDNFGGIFTNQDSMNKQLLKKVRDKIPEPINHLTAPFIRKKLIKNDYFCSYYNMLKEREGLSAERIHDYQLGQLKNILVHANDNIPYYHELFRSIGFHPEQVSDFDDISVIPYLTKDIIRNNFEKLQSVSKVRGGSYSTTTSGSTGQPLKILLDYDSFFKENAFLYYYRRSLGYDFKDKLITFRGIEFGDKIYKFNPINNETIFSPFKLSLKTIGLYRQKINEIQPAYFNGYFSSIYYLAKLLDETNQSLDFNLKGIFLSSENINESERLFVESFFGVKSLTFYGHTERCVLAQEVEHSNYSFDRYYGFAEEISTDDGSYEIVGTGFLNKTMPLIRYKTGDICQKSGDNFITISGRREINDYLVGVNGEKVFNSSLHLLSDLMMNVTMYQFIQGKKGEASLFIIPGNDFQCSEIRQIKKELDREMKGIIDFKIKIGEKLLLSSRGKYQMFISNLNYE